MLWQMEKTSLKSKVSPEPHITLPIRVLTDVMQVGKSQSISKGKMVITDHNDVSKDELEQYIDQARRRA